MKHILAALFLICTALSFHSCTKGGDQLPSSGAVYSVTGAADGKQLVPQNALAATGSISGLYDEQANVLTFTLTWGALWTTAAPDAITGIKFYGGAAAGTNGTPTHTISFANSTSASGSINLGLGGSVGFSAGERSDMYSGKAYFIITTQKYPDGVIRGQLAATKQ